MRSQARPHSVRHYRVDRCISHRSPKAHSDRTAHTRLRCKSLRARTPHPHPSPNSWSHHSAAGLPVDRYSARRKPVGLWDSSHCSFPLRRARRCCNGCRADPGRNRPRLRRSRDPSSGRRSFHRKPHCRERRPPCRHHSCRLDPSGTHSRRPHSGRGHGCDRRRRCRNEPRECYSHRRTPHHCTPGPRRSGRNTPRNVECLDSDRRIAARTLRAEPDTRVRTPLSDSVRQRRNSGCSARSD